MNSLDFDFKEANEFAAKLEALEKRRKAEEEAEKLKQEKSDGIFTRQEIVFRKTFGEMTKVELIEFKGVEKCDGAVVLEGIPGGNLTSILAAGYFAKQLDLPTVAVMRVPSQAPQCVIKGAIPYQCIRICGNEKLVTLQSEQPITGAAMTHNLVKCLLDFCLRHKARMLITVEGIPTKATDMADANRLRFITTDPEFSKYMKANSHLAIINGVIAGFTGQLLADAGMMEDHSTHVSAILAKVDLRLPSAYGAVHVVKAINSFLGDLKIDLTDLEDSAFELEYSLKAYLKTAAKNQQKEAPMGMYI